MNYVALIRSFWRAHEEHSFGTTEVAVYFYLLEVCNICHWKNPFKRNNAKIEADLGISFNTLKNARNKLVQSGLLSFKTTNGSPNVVYTLSKFDEVTNEVSVEVGDEVSNEVTNKVGDEIIKTKQNKTKQIIPPTPHSGGEGADKNSFPEAKPVKPPLEKEKSSAKKEKPPPLRFDFVEEKFREAFMRFVEYRKDMRKPFKTQQGVEACYKKLKTLSGGDPQTAAQIVEQSIASEWQGLFELKNQQNGNKNNSRFFVGAQDYGESTI
jgi:hypothetical protein